MSREGARRPPVVWAIAWIDAILGAFLLLFARGLLADESRPDRSWLIAAVLATLGLGHVFVAMYLPTLENRARELRLALAVPDLVLLPVGTVLSAIVWVVLRHPAIRARFRGELLSDQPRPPVLGPGGAISVVVLFVASIFLAAVWASSLLCAIDRGKQKRTMADLRQIGNAVEAYVSDHGFPPDTRGRIVVADELIGAMHPDDPKRLPRKDGWGNPIGYWGEGTDYCLFSLGMDGIPNRLDLGCRDEPVTTNSFDDEIVFSGGRFVKYPEGLQQ